MLDRIVAQPLPSVQVFPLDARTEYEAWSDEVRHREAFQLVKSRFSSQAWWSSDHADSITRRGEVIIVRHGCPCYALALREITSWRAFLSERLPEAEILSVTVDRKMKLRAFLRIPVPLVPCCGGCGGWAEACERECPDCLFKMAEAGGQRS